MRSNIISKRNLRNKLKLSSAETQTAAANSIVKIKGGDPLVTGISFSRICLFAPTELDYISLGSYFDSSPNIKYSYTSGKPDEIDTDNLVRSFFTTDNLIIKCRISCQKVKSQIDIYLDEVTELNQKTIRLKDAVFTYSLTEYDSGWATITTTISLTTKSDSVSNSITHAKRVDDNELEGLSANQVVALTRYFSCRSNDQYEYGDNHLKNYKTTCLLKCSCINTNHSVDNNLFCSKNADGFMSVIWGLHSPYSDIVKDHEENESLDRVFAGLLTQDNLWYEKTEAQVKERLGKHVGPPVMQARVCGDHVVIISDPNDCGIELEKYGTFPSPLRALEYAVYQNAIVLAADKKVTGLEITTDNMIRNVLNDEKDIKHTDIVVLFSNHLKEITKIHSQVLSQCEAHFKPRIHKYELEHEIVKSIMGQAITEKTLESIRIRLNALNTLANELHGIEAGERLKDQQERLVGILNTNLVSQLELRRLNKDSKKSTEKLAWLNAIVAFSAALGILQLIMSITPKKADFIDKLSIFVDDFAPISKSFFIGVAGLFVIALVLTFLMGSIAKAWEWFDFRFFEREKNKDMFSPRHSMELNKMLKQAEIVKIIVANFNKLNKEERDNLEDELIKQHNATVNEDSKLVDLLNIINKMHKKEAAAIKFPKLKKFMISMKNNTN
ncbi:MAG: hypothetical protein JJE30_11085 [Desulfuromonadales bacterium]|nr:hypothetical protein [Desulfuromonadales bacterium]